MTTPPGFRDPFKAGRNIHAVAKYIIVFNYDVADVDPDTKLKALVRRDGDIALLDAALNV